jgi:3-oxoacyl-[acyl-carrier protein] reductase
VQELAQHVAVVTGGARNIGRAIACDLAAGGAAVVLVARSDLAGLEETAGIIRARGGQAHVVQADITNEGSVAALAKEVEAKFGHLDILVNNAALRAEDEFEAITLQQWRDVMAVNLDGAFLVTRAMMPLLKKSKAAAIINMGGLTAYTGAAKRAHVVAAKAALDGLTKALAHEFAPHGITVNLISPGLIDTARHGRSAARPDHHKQHATLLGRRGFPEEVASMVRHLSGPNGRYITGQTIHVNGGVYLP